jgi:hypothetical protein
MKRNLIGTLSLVVLSLLLNATGAYAQAVVKADVPFAFMVGKKQLPAGSYAILPDGQSTIVIRNGDTGAATLSLVRQDSPGKSSPKLVFHHLGSQYFLAQVWGAAGREGMIIPTTPLEKELRIAQGPSNTLGEVVIALK